MDRRDAVEKALRDGGALPAGPMVVSKISELCKDPRASARDLGKVLQLDPAITTRVLKQVNSSFYGLSATIKTVTHAVVILGFQEIKNIALSVPVASLYEDNMNCPGIDVAALWEKTVEIACLARTLSYHVKHDVPEQVFVSAILSNTGMVILNSILGTEYSSVVDSCTAEEFLPDVEKAELGISNVDVTKRLAEKWHFPPDLVDAISMHYSPVRDGKVMVEAAFILTARRLRSSFGAGESPEEALAKLPPEIVAEFSLTPEAIATAYEKASSEFGAAKSMLGSGD